ncbi:MAG: hypothetical protein ACK2T6_04760 [Anaerolineae bacterium]|jgi:hypothetical protein
MYPHSHRWRDDRLGTLLGKGLADVRQASPPTGTWRRIEQALEPPREPNRAERLLQRFAADPFASAHSGTGLLPWLALPGATVLSVLLLIAVSLHAAAPGAWDATADTPVVGEPTSFGLTEPEFAMQPEMDTRLVSVAIAPGPTERYAPPARDRRPSPPIIRSIEDAPRTE